MSDYRYIENGVFRYEGDLNIPEDTDNIDWLEYLQYVEAGGETDPMYTNSELIDIERDFRYNETQPEYVRRLEHHSGKKHRGVHWEHSKYSKILNRKIDGTATNKDLLLLDLIDTHRDDLENLQDYIEDEVRTLEELQNLDVTAEEHWNYVKPTQG